MRSLAWTVGPEDDGRTVEELLRRRLLLSTGAVRRAKRLPGGLCLDGAPVRTVDRARAGQVLTAAVGDAAGSDRLTPTPGPLDVRYEDEDLIVLSKPGGMPVHPSQGHHGDTLADRLAWRYAQAGLIAAFHPVNRLDGGTSGLMAVAKHAHAHERLQAQQIEGTLHRTYLAVCEGAPAPPAGTIDAPIGRVPGAVLAREVRPDGAAARTRYAVLRTGRGRSLVRAEPETGRTHQIRVHLAHLGCPLAGDFLYGRELAALPDRFALHSATLALRHPVTGAPLTFTDPLPAELARLLEDDVEKDS